MVTERKGKYERFVPERARATLGTRGPGALAGPTGQGTDATQPR